MRIDLNVPYPRKDEAKYHGARWDAAKKVWYFNTEHVSPDQMHGLQCFIPSKTLKRRGKQEAKAAIKKAQRIEPRATGATDFSLPACSCSSAPWEGCMHTTGELDPEALAHLRAIEAER